MFNLYSENKRPQLVQHTEAHVLTRTSNTSLYFELNVLLLLLFNLLLNKCKISMHLLTESLRVLKMCENTHFISHLCYDFIILYLIGLCTMDDSLHGV